MRTASHNLQDSTPAVVVDRTIAFKVEEESEAFIARDNTLKKDRVGSGNGKGGNLVTRGWDVQLSSGVVSGLAQFGRRSRHSKRNLGQSHSEQATVPNCAGPGDVEQKPPRGTPSCRWPHRINKSLPLVPRLKLESEKFLRLLRGVGSALYSKYISTSYVRYAKMSKLHRR